MVIPKGHDLNGSEGKYPLPHSAILRHGRNKYCTSKSILKERDKPGCFSKGWLSTELGLDVGSWGWQPCSLLCWWQRPEKLGLLHDPAWPASAGGSYLLLSLGMHPWAGTAGWALPQISVSDLSFPSPLSLSRVSPFSHSFTSHQAGWLAENLKHGMLLGLPPGESFRLCPTGSCASTSEMQKGLELNIPILFPTSLISNT